MRLFAIACLLFSTTSFANTTDLTWSVQEVDTPSSVLAQIEAMENAPAADVERGDISISEIINLGKFIWGIIKENKPVLNAQYDYANAIPKGAHPVFDVEGFSNLQRKSYQYKAVNTYGMTAVQFTYTVVHRYGGNVRGKGRFLDNVSVIPSDVQVNWGYNVDFNVTRVSTNNIGTLVDPVASIIMETTLRVSTPLKIDELRQLFQFNGDSATVVGN
jgi:hypothetical protein